MKKNKLSTLRKELRTYNIDGYIIPKNDEFFGEYVDPSNERLKYLTGFSGSAGQALFLKKKAFLFVDGRYTLQAQKEIKNNPVITKKIIANISENAFIIDVGKGTLYDKALKMAGERDISVYRLDVTSAIEGLLTALYSSENIMEHVIGRRKIDSIYVVSVGFPTRNQ